LTTLFPESLLLLQKIRAQTPVAGSTVFFNKCAESRGKDSQNGRQESGLDCGCFGWGEDGFDGASKSNIEAIRQLFNADSPWKDIPCYQRRAADGSEWRHAVDNTTCLDVSEQLLNDHRLCDWEYTSYCCECHGLDSQFRANPQSPWFDEFLHEQCSDVTIPAVVVAASSEIVPVRTLELTRLPTETGHTAAWVRLDLQFSELIREVKIEFERQSLVSGVPDETLWNTIKHYEIQIGDEQLLDANPVYASYLPGDEHQILQCEDCEPQLASVDSDLLVWLRFDDPTFIGQDSSNYKTDARLMQQNIATNNSQQETHVPYKIPILRVQSVHGPSLWESLSLGDTHYLELGAVTLAPSSDFAVSFWFVGMVHPIGQKKHVILEMSTNDGTSFFRFEQNWHQPSAVTAFLTINNVPALSAISRDSLRDLIYSPSSATVAVGEWNHFLLSVCTASKTAKICLNGICLTMQDSVQADDANTYTVLGLGNFYGSLVLSSHMNKGVTSYCPRVATVSYACYEGQLDEILIYKRMLSDDEIIILSTAQTPAAAAADATATAGTLSKNVAAFMKPTYIPWLGQNMFLQRDIPSILGRYIFIKFAACNATGDDCNTRHDIAIAHVKVNRQRWHFETGSTWSWSGDQNPGMLSQEPWFGGEGLCFLHDVGVFTHRNFRGLAPFSVEMDLESIRPVSGFVFSHVSASPRFGSVRVYYDIAPLLYNSNPVRFKDTDLSTLSANNSSVEMFFEDGPVRARYVRIVLMEYPENPPCVSVAPVICSHYCVGCCHRVQMVDATALPVLNTDSVLSKSVDVWHTGHTMCKCSEQRSNKTEAGFLSERVFRGLLVKSPNVSFFECHHSMQTLTTEYDLRHSCYRLGTAAKHKSGYRALVTDGIIDFAHPTPIILQQGVATVIDWSDTIYADNPVYIANQSESKDPWTGMNSDFVTISAQERTTTILVPTDFSHFQTLTLYYYYAHANISKPVAIILVHASVSSDLRVRSDLFCNITVYYEAVNTLCPCDRDLGRTDPWGISLAAVVTSIQRTQVVSDSILPLHYTHVVRPTNGEQVLHGDHIFAAKPQAVQQSPFFDPETTMASLEAGGEFVQFASTRPVVVNRFGELGNTAMLYKDISYMENPFLCSPSSSTECAGNRVADTSTTAIIPLLHKKRTQARNRWTALDLQTEQNYFGSGGAGFVQRLFPEAVWNDDLTIHLTPHIGINVRYPSDSERPFRNDQREEMYNNYDAGTPIHMAVFVASKKLNTTVGSTDWDWIRCGSMTQNPIPYPPKYMSTSIALAERYTHGPDTLIVTSDKSVQLRKKLNISSVFSTAFASNNLWVSQGGFLPDPPVCWVFSSINAEGVSAQAPLGGSTVTHPNNAPCKLGQLNFPGRDNSALKAGYVRCDLTKNLKTHQALPCMYTLGDVMTRYAISSVDLELSADFMSVYQVDPDSAADLITNKRGLDEFTQKVAYGSRRDTTNTGMPLFVCHPQYNNLPYLIQGENTVLRPDIACAIPQGDMLHTLLVDCVCGIISRTYTFDLDGERHVEKIVRVIPQTEIGQGSSALPSHGYITELTDAALAVGDVLSIGNMTKNTTRALPTVYFASDPSTAGIDATLPSLPGHYDICDSQQDPDNIGSTNSKNPHILDGIVVPLGKTMNPDQTETDCCNFIRTHARVIALGNANQTKMLVAFVEGGNASSGGGGILSELWRTMAPTCAQLQDTSVRNWDPQQDTNKYPCSVTMLNQNLAMPGILVAGHGRVFIFDKVYVKTRGWLLVLFSSTLRMCGQLSCVPGAAADSNIYDWQVQHMRAASNVQTVANNYNVPNDAHMWQIGELLFGGVEGVGLCAERCPSSGVYENAQGTIKWRPKMPIRMGPTPVQAPQYWLYTTFWVGESIACKFYNCDEAVFAAEHAQNYADDLPYPDGHHPLTFFEGTSITALIPHKIEHDVQDGCIELHAAAIQYVNTTQTNALLFQMSTTLFGDQRVSDFDFCASCIDGTCHSSVMPCRWQSSIDSTWRYYMYLYLRSGDSVMLVFKIDSSGVQDSEYSNNTVFKGYTVTSAFGAQSPVLLSLNNRTSMIVFTTPYRKCADSSLLRYSVRGSRRLQEVYNTPLARVKAHSEHGRKQHTRRHYATFKSGPTHRTEKLELRTLAPQPANPGAGRLLLSFDTTSPVTQRQSLLGLGKSNQNMALNREITSINNNERVTAVVCARTSQSQSYDHTCHMLVVQRDLLMDKFCLDEDTFMLQVVPEIRMEILNATSDAVIDIVITSVARAQFTSKCAPNTKRRLLQIETVHITYVAVTTNSSFINIDQLVLNGYSGLNTVTTSTANQISVCSPSQKNNITINDNICVHARMSMPLIIRTQNVSAHPAAPLSQVIQIPVHEHTSSFLLSHYTIAGVVLGSLGAAVCCYIVSHQWKHRSMRESNTQAYTFVCPNEATAIYMPQSAFNPMPMPAYFNPYQYYQQEQHYYAP